MNIYLKQIFAANKIEADESGTLKELHSNTSMRQCLFIESVFDRIKPKKTVEVGLAMGLSALSILEKHKEMSNADKSHIIIEPFPWEGIAEHNIKKAGLWNYADIRYKKSDHVLTELFHQNATIQLAYIDTTKVFDIVMQDFYFIDKILEVGGVIILDDCGGSWPGIQKVARYINTLPHYKIFDCFGKNTQTLKSSTAESALTFCINLLPFKKRFFKGFSLKTDKQLGLNYNCIAFIKATADKRNWDWDAPL